MENAALTFYSSFKSRAKMLSKHFLKLTQKLTPMRVACAGGHIPIEEGVSSQLEADSKDSVDSDGEEADSLDEPDYEEEEDEEKDEEGKPTKKQKEVKYSKFIFESKFKVLLQELKNARDNDPSCEYKLDHEALRCIALSTE